MCVSQNTCATHINEECSAETDAERELAELEKADEAGKVALQHDDDNEEELLIKVGLSQATCHICKVVSGNSALHAVQQDSSLPAGSCYSCHWSLIDMQSISKACILIHAEQATPSKKAQIKGSVSKALGKDTIPSLHGFNS